MENQTPPQAQDVEVIDASTRTEVPTEQKIEGFRHSMNKMLNAAPISLLATLYSTVKHADALAALVREKKLQMIAASEDPMEQEAIRYNFDIDVLIDRAYSIANYLIEQRGELGEGQSLQPIHDAAIELGAVGLCLANSLVTGMEISDNPNYQPEPEEAPVVAP